MLGDATLPHVDAASFDLVFLVTTLGEIPNRQAALAQSYRALKPGGMLSVTEIFGDPHYQSSPTIRRLAKNAGFQFQSIQGHWWFFTVQFVKT
jgi:ubiquinone/menaquinone biosynthesis C-methylase UbiE